MLLKKLTDKVLTKSVLTKTFMLYHFVYNNA